MAEEIGFENGRNSNFQGLVTLTLTLDPVIRHTVVHHSSTSTYIPNFIEIEETFCGRTDGRTYVRTDIFPLLILLGRLLEVYLIKEKHCLTCMHACTQWYNDRCLPADSAAGLRGRPRRRRPMADTGTLGTSSSVSLFRMLSV